MKKASTFNLINIIFVSDYLDREFESGILLISSHCSVVVENPMGVPGAAEFSDSTPYALPILIFRATNDN